MSTREEREAAEELRQTGFSEEYIQSLHPEYDDLLAERDRLRVQNATLLAALEALLEALVEENANVTLLTANRVFEARAAIKGAKS